MVEITRVTPDGLTERAYGYVESINDWGNVFAISNTVPQDQVKDILYVAFVQACKTAGSRASKAEMVLPIGKLLDLR
jgi:hypothetical protein